MESIVFFIFLGTCFWSVLANNTSTTNNITSVVATTTSTSPLPSAGKSSSSTTLSVPITTSSNETRMTVPPTSRSTPATSTCSQRNTSCGDCVEDISCFWCGADDTCREYQASIKLIPRHCRGNKWYWKQCFAAGSVLIYVIPSVVFVILVITGCCVYCLCCRNRRQRSFQREDRKMQRRREEAQRRNAERRAERKIRTDAIRQKYGLLNSEDDNELA